MTPDPAWPAIGLGVVQAADAVFCAMPLDFVVKCLDDVGLRTRFRRLLPAIKAAAALGLLAGLWIPYLAAVTAACLTAYFALAVGAHVRANDIGRNMASATILLGASSTVLALSI